MDSLSFLSLVFIGENLNNSAYSVFAKLSLGFLSRLRCQIGIQRFIFITKEKKLCTKGTNVEISSHTTLRMKNPYELSRSLKIDRQEN